MDENLWIALNKLGNSIKQDVQDRFFVLTQSVDLDQMLTNLIKFALVDDETRTDEFLEGEQYLGTFSAKIQAAYCLGLISKAEYHDLNIIRKIRNDFAHKPRGLTFGNERIANLCRSLKLPQKVSLADPSPKETMLAAFTLLERCFDERFEKVTRHPLNTAPSEVDLSDMSENLRALLAEQRDLIKKAD